MLALFQRNTHWFWHTMANGCYERHGPFISRAEALYDMTLNAPVDALITCWHINHRGLA